MNPSTFLFKTVLSRTLEFVLPILKEELPKLKANFEGTFDDFPHGNLDYADIISSLAGISAFDTKPIVQYLCESLLLVFQTSCTRIFRASLDTLPEFDFRNKIHINFVKYFQIIFYTDCIFAILAEDEEFSGPKIITDTAYKVCAYSTQQQLIATVALPQWSVIMSLISKKNLKLIYESFSNMMINKPENYFILLQYVRLSSDDQIANDLAEVMLEYIKFGKRKKMLSSRMLSSVSTMLLTMNGRPEIIDKYSQIAKNYIADPNLKYGAIELMCSLFPKGKEHIEEVRHFYDQTVFALAKDPVGFTVVVRTFYLLLVGLNIDPDWLFWVWGPKSRKTELKNIESTKQEDNFFTNVFMEHIFTSPHFSTRSKQLRDILVFLAQQNFCGFLKYVVPPFLQAPDQHKFTTFLMVVPLINDDNFIKENNIKQDKLLDFNRNIAQITHNKLQDLVNQNVNYGIEESLDTSEAQKTIDLIFHKWGLLPGAKSEPLQHDAVGDVMDLNAQMMDVIPYILNSQVFTIEEWTTLLVKLAACGNSNISVPAKRIVEQNLDDPNIYIPLCEHIAGMVTLDQDPEIVWLCLELLLYATDGQEPKEDEEFDKFADRLEFTAFISLASEKPEVRKQAFKLLDVMNILQRNNGIMTHIDKNLSTIESNVKHSILMMDFPKKPGVQEYREMTLHLNDALVSPYQVPWLYFLAEFGRIVESNDISYQMKKLAKEFKYTQFNHFSLGVLVIFFSSCINPKYATSGYDSYLSSSTTQEMFTFQDLSKIIKQLTDTLGPNKPIDPNNMYLFRSLKHAHFTIVPNVLEELSKISCVADSRLVMNIVSVTNVLLRSIEEIQPLRQACLCHIFKIFNIPEIAVKKEIQQKILNEKLLLPFLNLLTIWIDTEQFNRLLVGWTVMKKAQIFILLSEILSSSKNHQTKVTESLKPELAKSKIGTYASYAIAALLEIQPPFAKNTLPGNLLDIVDSMMLAEDHGVSVLEPLCQNNLDIFLDMFIEKSFKQDPSSDYYFSALSNSIINIIKIQDNPDNTDNSDNPDLLFKNIDKLLLVGIYKFKTGSTLAIGFIQTLANAFANEFFKRIANNLKNDLNILPPNEVLSQAFVKKCEAVVQNALKWMIQPTFEGSPKVMVDILIPWIRNFRLLPKSSTCIPNINSVVNRMTPAQFLQYLMTITQNCKKQDFEVICELWGTLLSKEDHNEIIPNYIAESPNAELKKMIFLNLLSKYPTIIIECLAHRCQFSFYAYIVYQQKQEFDEQMWFVPVIQKAVRNVPKTNDFLPYIIQFALVFHSNQTQSLLKRLCKSTQISYSRRTLSVESLRKFVSSFITKLIELKGVEAVIEWASEATRWVVGSKSIRIAHISLVILDEIQRQFPNPSPKNLFYGICRSVSYFLKQKKAYDQTIYDFINETFILFSNHLNGNEKFAFDYIKIYFDFVVSVDAYFDNMIPLFRKCKESKVTEAQASIYLLNAIRPIFNELESDQKAMDEFQKIMKTEHSVDIDYVNLVLHPLDEKKEQVLNLIHHTKIEEKNRALGHYSFMALNASTDLKRRIFIVSSLILQDFITEREYFKNHFRSSKSMDTSYLESSSLATTSIFPSEPITSNFLESLKTDINKVALVGIFQAALAKITTVKEAVEFICQISKIDPLIPNVVVNEDKKWPEAASAVGQKLDELSKSQNEIVTLTNCEHLDSTSNLLSEESKPKILPFTTQHEMVESISKSSEIDSTPVRHIQKWVKALTDASVAFQKGVSAALSPSTVIYAGKTQPLIPPTELLDDQEIATNADESKADLLFSVDHFANKLGILTRRNSRPPSNY